MMNKICSALVATSSSLFSFSQTVFWTEGFQNGCATGCFATAYTGPNGTWTQTSTGTNDPESNKWFVSGSECGNAATQCGTSCGATDPSLHIGADDGFVFDPGAAYDAGGFCGVLFCVTTNMRVESPAINCTGQSTITLAFNYIENGSGTTDDASLWYYDGTTWAQINALAKPPLGGCAPQGQWTAFSIALPASADNNPNVKIGFNWTNNDDGVGTDPSFAVDDITLSVSGGCAMTASISATSSSVCLGQSATLTATSAGGSSPYTYAWSPSSGLSSPTVSNPVATPSATTTYTVTVTDNGVCSATNSVTITVNPLPVANAGTDVTICQSTNTTLSATGGGTYLWSPSTGLSNPNISNPVASPTITTAYSVTVTNTCGSNTDTVNITVNPMPTANAGADVTVCPGAITILTATGGGIYAWNTGSTTSSITVSPTVTTTYSVTATNACGSNTDVVNVVVSNNITASIFGNTTICSGQSTTLTASGGGNYSWNNSSTSSSIAVSPTANTSYTVYVTSGTCADTVSATVIISSPPTASATSTNVCYGFSDTLFAFGGGNYLWSNGATTSSIIVSDTTTTFYSVIVSLGSCSDTANATFSVSPFQNINAGSNVTITQGGSTTLTASGAIEFIWSTGDNSVFIIVSPTATTTYCVTGNDMLLVTCYDTACVTVTVEPLDCSAAGELYIPNAFSPNGDMENDVLQAYYGNVLCIKSLSIKIFDRWGEKVFESDKIAFVWDGVFNGKRINTEVFTYYLNAELAGGKTIDKKGNISLVR